MKTAGLLIALTILEGSGTLLWLLLTTSEPENRLLGAYSLERWALILFTAMLVAVFVFLFWTFTTRPAKILTAIEHFQLEKRADVVLVISTVVFVLSLALHIGLLFYESTRPHYPQLLPLLAFVTLATGQTWVFLLLVLRQSRSRLLKSWFPVYQEERSLQNTTEKWLRLALVGLTLAYVTIQIVAGFRVPQAVELGDTTSYLEGAGMSLRDPAFFSERRPWGILLVYKLLGGSLVAIGWTQLAVSIIAWLFLAWMLVGSLGSNVGKLAGFIFTLGISLSPTVQVWNHAGLSESFSVSTLILILAVLIGILQRWRWPFFISLIFFFALWVSIHEVNLYLGLLAAVVLFLLGAIRKDFRSFLILSLSIAVMLGINSRLSSFYALPRWALPVAEVITKRILPVPEYLEYFTSQGMPVRPELMALSGRWANSDGFAILNNPRLRPFSRWLFQESKSVYIRFLLSHPVYTLSMPLLNIDEMLAVDFSELIPGYEPALPFILNEFFFPIRWFWAYLAIAVLLIGLVLWKQRRETSRVYWLAVLFFVFSIPYLYLAWHGDALDLARHAAIANIQFHLGFGLLLIFYLDKKV